MRAPGQALPALPGEVELVEDAREGRGPLAGPGRGARGGRRARGGGLRVLDRRRRCCTRASCGAWSRPSTTTPTSSLPHAGGFPHPLAAAYRTALRRRGRGAARRRPAAARVPVRASAACGGSTTARCSPIPRSPRSTPTSTRCSTSTSPPTTRPRAPARRRRSPCAASARCAARARRRRAAAVRGRHARRGRGRRRRSRSTSTSSRRSTATRSRATPRCRWPPATRSPSWPPTRAACSGAALPWWVCRCPGGYFGRALVIDARRCGHRGAAARRRRPARLRRGRRARHVAHAPAGAAGRRPARRPRRRSPSSSRRWSGTPLTTSAKFAVVAKSPLTGLLNDALASSHFAIAGKLTGHDAIVVHGACAEPSVLLVDGDGAAAGAGRRPLGAVGRRGRGAAARAAGQGLARRLDRPRRRAARQATPRSRTTAATPAAAASAPCWGPSCSRPSRSGRRRRSRPPTRRRVLAAARDLRARSFGPATAKYRELGTLANLLAFNAIATLPTRNFQAATFAEAPRLAAEDLADARGVARDSCASCAIGCEHIYKTAGGKQIRVEYENVFALGPLCGVVGPGRRARGERAAATSSASTRSRPAARSPGRWSAPSAA